MLYDYSVIGLGKLGASMAAAFAKRGFRVIGVDVNPISVDLINQGHAPVQETDLETTISNNHERIHATLDHKEAVLNSDISFVIVPTPSNEDGAFSLQYASWAFREIGRALKEKQGYHVIVLTSTVLPGATRYGLLPILERESGKKCGQDFGLCYSPEFIALGSIIYNFLNPDFTLVGESDEKCGKILEENYAKIMENQPPCKRMSLENAELTKVALNTFVTTKITYANMLAELCERIPGGSVDIVTDALGNDSRIGSKYLKGAIGYGGPCFPRDNIALGYISRQIGVKAELAEVTDQLNRSLPGKVIERIRPMIERGATVAVLGLSYKPHSHVTEESQAISIVQALNKAGARVVAFDPLAGDNARVELMYDALVLDTAEDCLAQADIVLIINPDPLFKSLSSDHFKQAGKTVTVIDFWRILENKLQNQDGIHYIAIGKSINDSQNEGRLKAIWEQYSTEQPAA